MNYWYVHVRVALSSRRTRRDHGDAKSVSLQVLTLSINQLVQWMLHLQLYNTEVGDVLQAPEVRS